MHSLYINLHIIYTVHFKKIIANHFSLLPLEVIFIFHMCSLLYVLCVCSKYIQAHFLQLDINTVECSVCCEYVLLLSLVDK